MGYIKNAGLCGACRFFEWLEVGAKNRCKLDDFASASRNGCKFYDDE